MAADANSPHFAPARPRTSSSCSCRAGRARSICSIRSRSLQKWHGKPLPESLTKDLKLAFIKPTRAGRAKPAPLHAVRASPAPSFPTAFRTSPACADDMCVVRVVHTEAFNHDPGEMFLMTGSMQFGRPSMGAWVVYGLGSANRRTCRASSCLRSGNRRARARTTGPAAFCPRAYQGTPFRCSRRSDSVSAESRRIQRSRCSERAWTRSASLNEKHYARQTGDDGDRGAHRVL